MQCVTTGVVAAGATATGLRAWINTHKPAWATPPRMKAMTAALLTAGVLVAGVSASPASSNPTTGNGSTQSTQQAKPAQ
jgi:hypothetical protein